MYIAGVAQSTFIMYVNLSKYMHCMKALKSNSTQQLCSIGIETEVSAAYQADNKMNSNNF